MLTKKKTCPICRKRYSVRLPECPRCHEFNTDYIPSDGEGDGSSPYPEYERPSRFLPLLAVLAFLGIVLFIFFYLL